MTGMIAGWEKKPRALMWSEEKQMTWVSLYQQNTFVDRVGNHQDHLQGFAP